MAYEQAQKSYIKAGINRILIATDGDFNVGVTDFNALKGMIAEKRKSGISLTTLGFGSGNYDEQLMEQLADAGDGNYSYIDNEREAKKVLQRQLSSTLATVTQDVKIQVEFNPATVKEYRLIGYENRLLKNQNIPVYQIKNHLDRFSIHHGDLDQVGLIGTRMVMFDYGLTHQDFDRLYRK